MKKSILIIVAAILVLTCLLPLLSGCNKNEEEKADEGVLTVYNCEDYIDEEVFDEFSEWYLDTYGKNITVNYITYDTNETMLTKIMNNDAQVDVICTSEYAIQKLWQNELLLPINKTEGMNTINQEIYARTANKFGAEFENYFVPYMYGTLGILYNADFMEEQGIDVTEEGWSLLWNECANVELNGKILLKDSIRDTFAAGVMYLKEKDLLPDEYKDYSSEDLINCTDKKLLSSVKKALIEQKQTLKGYEVDFGKDDLIAGRAYVDLAWSGDAMYAIEEGELYDVGLDYFVPEVGSNVWFDGWFIPTCSSKAQAATAFIEFMCKPEISAANMICVGYTSAVDKAILMGNEDVLTLLEEAEYDADDFFSWEVRYPEINNPNYGMMTDYGEANTRMTILWEEVKAATASGTFAVWTVTLICFGAIALLAGIVILIIVIWSNYTYGRKYPMSSKPNEK